MIEFGCGYGTFSIPAARRVTGRVFALDIEPAMVAETAGKAAELGVSNLSAEVWDFVAHGCGRPDGSAGYAMLFNILHIEHPVSLLREAYRVLAAGGKLGLIHWRCDLDTPRGPPLPIRPTPDRCRGWAEEAGFEFVRAESLCCCSWHWGLVLRKPGVREV